MNNLPDWLPEMIPVDGNFNEIVNRLYNIFYHDFIANHPSLSNMDVWFDKKIKNGETYEQGFWHLIERDNNQGIRSFDPRRAERLPWCAPTLKNAIQPEVKHWICHESGKETSYVWLENFDYVIILEIRVLPQKEVGGVIKPARTIAFLKTAYHLDGESRRKYFRRKYQERIR